MSTLSARLRIAVVFGLTFLFACVYASVGGFDPGDRAVGHQLLVAWQPALAPTFWVVAALGGLDVSVIVSLGLIWFLWSRGFRRQILVLGLIPLSQVIEFLLKRGLLHPGPTLPFNHTEPHGLIDTLLGATASHFAANSFPSGHVLRTVMLYGIVTFLIGRLGPPGRIRAAVPAGYVTLVLLMAFDRVYLGVHWLSDVLGGVLLGGALLLATLAGLESVRKKEA